MKLNKIWVAVLAFWTLLLALWTVLCWNTWAAKAAEASSVLDGVGQGKAAAVGRFPETCAQPGADGPLDVPFLDQRDGFPTGCESVCAVMALQYFGADISVDSFVEQYLPLGDAPHWNEDGEYVGCDPREAFPGDPRTDGGWGCYAPVIEKVLNSFLADKPDLGLTVEQLEGVALEKLYEDYTAKGVPVLVWATIDMAEPYCSDVFTIENTGEEFHWFYPMHCLILTGREGEYYLFNDPMAGKNAAYKKAASELAYEGLGMQAVVLRSSAC